MPMATCKLNLKNYFNKLANTHWQNAPQWRISHQTWPFNGKYPQALCDLMTAKLKMDGRERTWGKSLKNGKFHNSTHLF